MSEPLPATIASASAAIAQSYDSVAYPAQPIAFTHPTRLGGVAKLFGLAARPMAGARVLEIGCADGGNLWPMAWAYPNTEFVGLELSPAQAERGAQRAAELGLNNLHIVQGDIASPPVELAGAFDFIIVHGVFSWVPETTQQLMLRYCHDHLSAEGVLYISYNVYPGWKQLEVLRDMMLHHAGSFLEPQRRIEQARAILSFTAGASRSDVPHGQWLREQNRTLDEQPDHYVFHEMLETHNRPLYFREFAGQAREHGLNYVGDVNLGTMTPTAIAPSDLQQLQALTGGNQELLEQHLDFINNRAFRTSVLVRADSANSLDRSLPRAALDALYLAPACVPIGRKEGDPQVQLFRDGLGNVAEVGEQALLVLLDKLLSHGLPWRTFGQWCGELAAIGGVKREPFAELLHRQIIPLLVGNLIHVHHDSPAPAARKGRLRAYLPAHLAAKNGAVRVVGKAHVTLEVGPPEALLLALADGSRDAQSIADEIAARAADGRLPIRFNAERAQTPEGARAEARRLVDMTIDRFDRLGLIDER